MKYTITIKLTKEQEELLTIGNLQIKSDKEETQIYYHLPQFFKKLDNKGNYEILFKEQLPEFVAKEYEQAL